MTTTSRTANPYGLEFQPSNVGREADAEAVAQTTALLSARVHAHLAVKADMSTGAFQVGRHAVALHVISGKLHRIAERQCNEDLTCRQCEGVGNTFWPQEQYYGHANPTHTCLPCAGKGNTLGRKEAKLEAGAKEIAAHYGLVVYFQTDPRGCALYLISETPAGMGERERREWVSSNYTRGHAVVRLG